MKDVKYKTDHSVAESILADKDTRLVRFSLLPGQSIKEHSAPSSQVHLIILEARGQFSDGDGAFMEFGPDTFIKYEQGEKHSIQAMDEKLVFVAPLKGSPSKENN